VARRNRLEGNAVGGCSLPEIKTVIGQSDWVICAKRESRFIGARDAGKREAILAYFLSYVGG
jgi:hypothetical protein